MGHYSMVDACDLLFSMSHQQPMSAYMINIKGLGVEMDELVRRGYMTYTPKSTLYVITNDGLAAAQRYAELVELIFDGEHTHPEER